MLGFPWANQTFCVCSLVRSELFLFVPSAEVPRKGFAAGQPATQPTSRQATQPATQPATQLPNGCLGRPVGWRVPWTAGNSVFVAGSGGSVFWSGSSTATQNRYALRVHNPAQWIPGSSICYTRCAVSNSTVIRSQLMGIH